MTDRAREHAQRIGETFEFHRAAFNPASVEEASAALARLQALVGVAPAPKRAMHDGTSPIDAGDGDVAARYDRLWNLLVPSNGAAASVQGEVVRVPGRLAREIHGHGGVNWDRNFGAMARAWLDHVRGGTGLSPDEAAEAIAIVKGISAADGETDRMKALAVAWVERNPDPVPLPRPDYAR